MNFTKYFKRKDYDNLDRFLLQQKFRNCRDPFDGDPFKVQSLNFRYADKPIFYPINNRPKAFGNAERPRMKNLFCNQANHHNQFKNENVASDNFKRSLLMKNESSSIHAFSTVSKPENLVSNSMPESSMESFERGVYSVAKKYDLNRSRSFIQHPMSVPFTENAGPASRNRTELKKNILKPKNNIETKKRTASIPSINVNHSGGCEITIKINGVPSNRVHINEKVKNCESSRNRTKSKPFSPKITSPYELKPSRSYVICRNDAVADDAVADDAVADDSVASKLVRECSTHSMIPHKEDKCTGKEFRKSSSITNTIGPSSSSRLKSESRHCSSQLNLSSKVSRNVCLENLARKNPRQASMLEKILSSNAIIAPSVKSSLLTKSKSVLDQRFTPVPMSGKYTFENNNNLKRRFKI